MYTTSRNRKAKATWATGGFGLSPWSQGSGHSLSCGCLHGGMAGLCGVFTEEVQPCGCCGITDGIIGLATAKFTTGQVTCPGDREAGVCTLAPSMPYCAAAAAVVCSGVVACHISVSFSLPPAIKHDSCTASVLFGWLPVSPPTLEPQQPLSCCWCVLLCASIGCAFACMIS